MPELPEVETVVRDLRPVLVGQSFGELSTSVPAVVLPSVEAYLDLQGLKVLSVERRGKYIHIFFERDFVMTLHLRMTGRIILQNFDDEPLKYERTRIDFSESSLRFCDLRKFGRIWVSTVADFEEMTGVSRLGVEPLSSDFTFERFSSMMRGRRGCVKKWLLDQSLIAGIGNIYADEACFYAGVRPDAEISRLKRADLERLFSAVLTALNQGVRNRGTSISDYADAYGKSGKNQELLYVYGRGGRPCINCSAILVKARVAGRGTVFCGGCQLLQKSPISDTFHS